MSETESVPVDAGGSAPESTSVAPDAGAPSPAADAAAPSAPSAGTPRGPDGRFTSAATQPPAPLDAASVADPSAPAALDTTTTDPSAPNAPPAAAPTPSTAPQPFTFRASGTRVPIEGATYEPGKGLVIPDAQVQQVRRLLAHGYEYATAGLQRERDFQQRIAEMEQAMQAAQSGSDAELEVQKAWFRDLLGDTTGARLLQAVQNFEGEAALLSERAMRAKLEAQLKAQQAARPAEPQVTPEQQQQQLVQTLVKFSGEFVEDLKESGEFAALTESDWSTLAGLVAKKPGMVYGERDGMAEFDGTLMYEWAQDRQKLRAESQKQTQQVAKAAEYNAKRQAPPAAPPPPKPPAPARREEDDNESILVKHAKGQAKYEEWQRKHAGW